MSLRGKALTAQNEELVTPSDAASNIGTQGVAPKAWIREGNTFCLLKDGDERDVKAELLASRIARCFKAESVLYEPAQFEGVIVSKSRIITSEEESIVPLEAVDVYCANHELDRDAFVLQKDAYSYHMMNLIDYLVGNTDRHWGNWGFLVDNRTNRLGKLHPLMDFNKAFLAYDSIEGARCLPNAERQSQLDAAIEAVRQVGMALEAVPQKLMTEALCLDAVKQNGLADSADKDGNWWYYTDGKIDTNHTGVDQNKYGWWRVENGKVNFNAQGIYQNSFGWWKTTNGKVTFKENSIYQNQFGWWKCKDSKVDFHAQSIYQNKFGWWKTTNGKVTFKENGLFKNQYGTWKVENSKVNFNFNGTYQGKTIKNGKVL